ncbi:MAG: SEC-C domain-containing protein [Moritella sp.]|uniref:PBPRA1643 family SWIM/SEC-C metal-binding motif protein n=1 Tax=Moritella sp. TaxID=78556 RepID=UPI0025FF6EEC|nr:PBPRA1643 family SWIM/SEC-C metal-binding motif protein [Moritella sp.]NQZ93574.1 SEC-C domain-containing protein [Moritella sp.]
MSKMFFKGRIDARQNHVKAGYNTKRDIKLGTDELPLNLVVQTAERQTEVEAILADTKLVANIEVNADKEENIRDLDGMLNKPKTTVFEKTPNRNAPCSCGSGKKYKKCCA